MNRSAVLLALFLAPAAAAWGTETERLDLSLPDRPIGFGGGEGRSSYANDPPGTYYGDTSGRPASEPALAQEECSPQPQLSGSVGAGIGYSERFGSSHWTATRLHLHRCRYGEDGGRNTFDLSIGVSQGDGPGGYGGPYHMPGPLPPVRAWPAPPMAPPRR